MSGIAQIARTEVIVLCTRGHSPRGGGIQVILSLGGRGAMKLNDCAAGGCRLVGELEALTLQILSSGAL